MIIIAGTVQINPSQRDHALQAARMMCTASEAEAGCLVYRIAEDIQQPNTFRIFELWDNEAALEAHFQTDHMATFNALLPTFLAGEPQIRRYDVDTFRDL